MQQSVIEMTVESSDIDRMGHVNNSKYLNYLTEGRIDWFNNAGFPFEFLQANNLGRAVVNLNINFRKEALLNQKLTVTTKALRFGKTSIVFKQEIFNEKELLCDAEVTDVIMHKEKRRSEEIPPKLVEYLERVTQ